MGKISDVIRHAGELSEETDDEDLWEDEDPETEAEEDPAAERENGGNAPVWEQDPDEEGARTFENENVTSEGGYASTENSVVQVGDRDTENTDEPYHTGSEEAFGETESFGSTETFGDVENGTFGPEKTETPDEEEFRPEEDPECNEEGVPIKDILYAESVRRRGKDQILVQSVYDLKLIRNMLFCHAYLSTGGYCGLLISFCSIGAAIYTYGRIQTWISFVLLLAGCIFTVIEPFLLRDRAKQMTRKGGIYHMPILFVLTPYGIELTRNGNHASHDWGDITRVTTTKYAVVMYKGKHTALVLTKKGIGDQKDQLYALIRKNARNAKYMKLK